MFLSNASVLFCFYFFSFDVSVDWVAFRILNAVLGNSVPLAPLLSQRKLWGFLVEWRTLSIRLLLFVIGSNSVGDSDLLLCPTLVTR